MAIRNTSLGGTDWNFEETNLQSADLNDTFDAVSVKIADDIRNNIGFRLITTGTGFSRINSDDGLLTNTSTINIPAGEVSKFIQINMRIYSKSVSSNSANNVARAWTKYRLYKTYSAVSVDLVPLHFHTDTYVKDENNAINGHDNYDTNETFLSLYYAPTEDEKANGFDVVIYGETNGQSDTSSSDYAELVVDNIVILGV